MNKLKRYLVFAGAYYYPGGGWTDFDSSFDTVEEAVAKAAELRADKNENPWTQVIDGETGEELKTE